MICKIDDLFDVIEPCNSPVKFFPDQNPTRRLSRIKERIARQTPVLRRKWQSGHSDDPPRIRYKIPAD
jgi:hypothetical protein